MTPMINCDPDEDRVEESDEEECAQYDSPDNLTENLSIGTVEIHETKTRLQVAALFESVHFLKFVALFEVGGLLSVKETTS